VLSDGATVHVRPIRPDDAERLVAFHSRQSAESIYFRYFSSHPRLSDREVAYFTQVDHHDRVAFVALLGDELIAVARYEPTGRPGQAEVAFFVDDRHHGRGLATLLLEYLVVAAREAGYDTLTATVLPGNNAMLTTFRRAGFETTSTWDGGVVEVAIDLEPTEREAAAIAERERRADARSVARLLRPTSVVVIGAGREPDTLGHRVVANLLDGGFQGPVFPVNERADHVHSVLAYRSVADLPTRVDLAVVAVPPERLDETVDQCARHGIGGMVVTTAGVDGAELATRARGWGRWPCSPRRWGRPCSTWPPRPAFRSPRS
jgi:RimJ/RimL family protein N-acetyltransferase/predicted CoA-binding protein